MFAIWIKDYFSDDYIKLDLFDKETVMIKSQLNNLEKLSNVFSDVSNSFTIPATPKNNKAMRHWYDRDIITNFNANINIPAYTEVGSLPYRYGNLSIESGQMESNKPKNYKVSFFSKNTQLSDTFGNDTIDRLDYDANGVLTWNNLSQYDFLDTSANFYNSISNVFQGGNVITPMIGISDRDWEWGSGNIFDIGSPTYSITNRELLYAFKIKNIINGIQEKYGITFTSTFFEEDHFNRLFIWLNNDKVSAGNLNQTLLNFTTGSLDDLGFNYATDTWNIYSTDFINKPRYRVFVEPDILDVPYTIVVKDNGNVISRFECDGGEFETPQVQVPWNGLAYVANYQYFLECERTITYDVRLKLIITFPFPTDVQTRSGNAVGIILDNYKIEEKLPKMKVIDFITALMKMFKLIIRPISINEFYIDTLDNYYALGNIINISNITNITEVNYKKPEIYTLIKYKYKKTDNVLGKKFREMKDPINDEIGYGDLKAEYKLDTKKELSIELPFENMLFERMVTSAGYAPYPLETTDLLFGQSSKLTDDGTGVEKNFGAPILFYNNGTQSLGTFSVYFKHNTAAPQLKNIVYNCGNTDSKILDDVTTSLNWGAEIDPWYLQVIYPSLYLNYWSRWLNSIYDLRQMRWTYKARLPIRYINEISLNDSLIIGQKRYRIESMTVNLINGDTTFELFVDTDIYLGLPDV